MSKVSECAQLLVPFFEAIVQENHSAAGELREKIANLERQADTQKKELRSQLPKTLFMPVARADLLDLVSVQDQIANISRDIAGIMIGRRMSLPAETTDLFLEFIKRSVATTAQADKTIEELDEIFESGFKGAEADLVEQLIEHLDESEESTDNIEIEVRSRLFSLEKNLPPVDVMFLYKIIDLIGDLADEAQRVGSRLQLLLAQ